MTYTFLIYFPTMQKHTVEQSVYSDTDTDQYLKEINTEQVIDLKAYGYIRKYQCMYQIHDLHSHIYCIGFAYKACSTVLPY